MQMSFVMSPEIPQAATQSRPGGKSRVHVAGHGFCSVVSSVPRASILSASARPYRVTATAGSDVVQSGRPIFDDLFQHLRPYIGNNTANVVLQMVKRLWLIRIDQ
ncbi:hypothetical protein TNCV_5136061 [Trichonephila clavipes]|nr:hypothetical protein TNCV_5136061 [Trichonephila clavipes]